MLAYGLDAAQREDLLLRVEATYGKELELIAPHPAKQKAKHKAKQKAKRRAKQKAKQRRRGKTQSRG